MYKSGTTLVDHPVIQAQDGLRALESFRTTKDPALLAQAKLDAQRLLDRKVQRDDGFFFPYPFDFAIHGSKSNTLRAPWFSGMTQGQALSLFARLADITEDPSWRVAADATFVSLLLPADAQDASLPFVSWVDANKHLWIEEYAKQPLPKADHTFNGHVFAVFGVWDYYRISQDPRAAEVSPGRWKPCATTSTAVGGPVLDQQLLPDSQHAVHEVPPDPRRTATHASRDHRQQRLVGLVRPLPGRLSLPRAREHGAVRCGHARRLHVRQGRCSAGDS